MLYVLDEPSIGLHQRDNARLLATLLALRDLGNTVVVVEHDPEMILAADHVIDMGPGAGVHGGEVVAVGTPAEIVANPGVAHRTLPVASDLVIPSRRIGGAAPDGASAFAARAPTTCAASTCRSRSAR